MDVLGLIRSLFTPEQPQSSGGRGGLPGLPLPFQPTQGLPESVGWQDALGTLDALDDPGIGTLRQIRGIDEGYGQGGPADMVFRLLGDMIQGGDPYASPYTSEEHGGQAEAMGLEPANMGERLLGGMVVPGGGMADIVDAGVGLARHADDVLSLADNAVRGAANAVTDLTDPTALPREMMRRIPAETQGLARVIYNFADTGDSGIAAARKGRSNAKRPVYDAAGNATGEMASQTALRETWLQDRMASLGSSEMDEWERVMQNGIGIENANRALTLPGGTRVDLNHWYDTTPVQSELRTALGEREGDMAYAALMSLMAVTSPLTSVRENVDIAVSMLGQISRGVSLEEIATMSRAEFGTTAPGNALRHAGYAGTSGDMARTQGRGALGKLLEMGEIDGQKISSFFNNLMGNYVPLTVDSHNIRQTLALSGIDMTDAAARRRLVQDLGISDMTGLQPYLEDTVRVVDAETGAVRTIAPDKVGNAFADALYANAASGTGLYSTIENFQLGVMNRLIDEGRIPPMTPAEFQARLWVGGADTSKVADPVPAAQAMIDAIATYGREVAGTEDLTQAIQHMWRDPQGGNVLVDAVYQASGMAESGISRTDFQELLARGAARATPAGGPGGDAEEGGVGNENQMMQLLNMFQGGF